MIGMLVFLQKNCEYSIDLLQAHRPLLAYQIVLICIFKMSVPIPRPNEPSSGCEKRVPGTRFHVFDCTQPNPTIEAT